MNKFVFAMLLALAAANPGFAALSPADHGDIDKAETYLNGVTNLKARFLQVAPDGGTSEGTLTMARPGHLRLDYDPPTPMVIFADSNWLVYHDSQLKHTSFVDVDSTPAGLLVKPHLKLDGEGAQVTNVAHKPGVLEITLSRPSDPRQGKLTLVFEQSPFQLKQWHVVDAQNQITTVSLFDTHLDAKFDKDWFNYRNSNTIDQSGIDWGKQ